MDSLQGITVEYKLDTFNMPRTGTTLCHPKIGYVDLTRNPALDTLALNSPLGHLNGDSANSPHQIPDTKLHGDSKAQSLTRPTTHAAISTFPTSHNISSKYSQPFTSLAAPKANPIFHAANKNLILKHISTLAILLHHHPFISYKLSEGTNNTKWGSNQHNVNTHTLHHLPR